MDFILRIQLLLLGNFESYQWIYFSLIKFKWWTYNRRMFTLEVDSTSQFRYYICSLYNKMISFKKACGNCSPRPHRNQYSLRFQNVRPICYVQVQMETLFGNVQKIADISMKLIYSVTLPVTSLIVGELDWDILLSECRLDYSY